ncbi:hypothetical protein [Muricoccus radiodurans]|uniref:hypothetical protein n=1 Tax=Muricoccus radiodurans TaxID=2231721 RepID=UPI003CEE3690
MPDSSRSASDLVPASDEELATALAYALRFDARGKARRGGGDLAASLAGERLAEHLRRAGFVLMREKGARPHSAG